MRKRFNIKSIYLKLILIFLVIIWVSGVVAFSIIFATKWNTLKKNICTEIIVKAENCQMLYNKYHTDVYEIKKLQEDNYIKMNVFSGYEDLQSNAFYKDAITEVQYNQIISGKMLEFESLKKRRFLPAVGIRIGDYVVIIHPRLNLIENFSSNAYVLLICVFVDSILIAFAARMIVRPIKKLTAATKDVSKGNFDIRVETESGDEIGQLTENFNIMTAELRNMEYLRKNFISNVSHEFKTPITAIQGFVKLIRDRKLTQEEFNEYTNIIFSETGHLSNLSSNLLRLATVENQAICVKTKHFSLDEQIRRVILLLENKWSQKDISLDLDINEVEYCGDEELLQQVWINLIANAIKFSNDGGIIKVFVNKTEDTVKVKITDNGKGISDEDKDRIYEMFYKGDKSRSNDGSGLGLAIVKKIVELHNGKVYFESVPGSGTTFTVLKAGAKRIDSLIMTSGFIMKQIHWMQLPLHNV